MALSFAGNIPEGVAFVSKRPHTNEPVRILTMYDGQLTPP